MSYDGYQNSHAYEHQQGFGSSSNNPVEFSSPSIPPPHRPNPDPYYQQHPTYPNSYQPEIKQNTAQSQRLPQNQPQYHSPLPQQHPPPLQHPPPPPNTNLNVPGSYPPDQALYYQQQHQNILVNDAINAAVNKADPYLNPDLVSQIAATVIQQLKGVNIEGHNQGKQQPFHSSPAPTVAQAYGQPPPGLNQSNYSPSAASGQVYTPPSPDKPSDEPVHYYSSPPPQHPQSRYGQNVHRSPRSSPVPENPNSSPFGHEGFGHEGARPRGPIRLSTATEETTLEKIWGQLFDREGNPTAKLGQLLRGIAVHLIEEYSPRNSLVVTPAKMQKYYEEMNVLEDSYPWRDIFDDQTSNISRLYREVRAEHHLVQDSLDSKPEIPGLTPCGFERWATLMIQTHPDQEFARLQRTVRKMPISNPNNRKERFPKEISRRLFPRSADYTLREYLERHISKHCQVDLLRNPKAATITTSFPEAQSLPQHYQQQQQQQQRSTTQRYHDPSGGTTPTTTIPLSSSPSRYDQHACKTYPRTSSAQNIVDPHESQQQSLPLPIERERQPYSIQPGGGKAYKDSLKIDTFGTTSTSPRHHQRHSHDINGMSGRQRSPFDGAGGYGKGHRHAKSDLHAHHQHGTGGSGSLTSASVSPFLDEFEDYDYGYEDAGRDGGDGKYSEKGRGELDRRMSYERSRNGDREREREREQEGGRGREGRERVMDMEGVRDRDWEKEREKNRYWDDSSKGSWVSDEDYYGGGTGLLGGRGGGGPGGHDQGAAWRGGY
ncbi:hypothetical protein PAAG_06278 [Paracoccidioides lutzii Pb01]|uniref:DUF7514 domain-containing protein n=1 Tax=Paracoccidioides lutzii (strain ATCC MYA-826 / Pb01) TaxID=502779 RepID=C1H5T3_PARBA|nr:hypothetical protein PAAG_06278 [Paracoccidioides lutzii Pb01]EEH35231.1 hypothetical protein PAAG_06278 [Paracoccidioides lutzii Pb01]